MNSSLNPVEFLMYPNCSGQTPDDNVKFFFEVVADKFLILFNSVIILLIRKTVNIPHTVILFCIGIILGLISEFLGFEQTRFALCNPEPILHILIPYFIFGSTFTLDIDMFRSVANYSVILGTLGFLLSVSMMYFFAIYLYPIYKWSYLLTGVFSIIMFTTDPFIVGRALENVSGEMRYVCMILEGEGLVNTTLALLLLTIYQLFIQENPEFILLTCVKIILLSVTSGFVIGKTVNYGLSKIENDTLTEIMVYITVPYVIYCFNQIINGNGFLAVLIGGIIINQGKTNLPPQILQAVNDYWNVLNYVFDTVMHLLNGLLVAQLFLKPVVVFEKSLTISAYMWIIQIYILIIVIRMITILLLSPFLKRAGYELNWKDVVILIWASMRGIVSLLIGLNVRLHYGNDDYLMAKILFQTGGIMFLMLLNHISVGYLLDAIGKSAVSLPARARMIHAVTHLRNIVAKSIRIQHLDQFMSVANWQWVKGHTYIEDPYQSTSDQLEAISYFKPRTVICIDCFHNQSILLTKEEQENLTKELNLRALKAAKVHYWKQFNMGLIRRETARLMATLASKEISKKKPEYLDAYTVIKCMTQPDLYDLFGKYANKFNKFIDRYMGKDYKGDDDKRRKSIIYSRNYEYVLHILLIFPFLLLLIGIISKLTNFNYKSFLRHYISSAQFIVLSIDLLFRVRAVGIKTFLKNCINQICILLLVLNLALIFKSQEYYQDSMHTSFLEYCCFLIIFRLILIFKFLCICVNKMVIYSVNSAIHQNFDIAVCFLKTEEENFKKVEGMLEYKDLVNVLKEKMKRNQLIILREMMTMQHEYPVMIIAAKRRLASRFILLNASQAIAEIKEEGILDDFEYDKLFNIVQNKLRNLLIIPKYVKFTANATTILQNVKWIVGKEKYEYFCKLDFDVRTFLPGIEIKKSNSYMSSIFIIMSGIVKVTGIMQPEQNHVIPFKFSMTHIYSDSPFEYYLSICDTFGLVSLLGNKKTITRALCETEVNAIIISMNKMRLAMRKFSVTPSLEYDIWWFVALHMALPLLVQNQYYKFCPLEKLKQTLENAIMPNFNGQTNMSFSDEILDVILIQGKVVNERTNEVFRGATILPRYVKHVTFADSTYGRERIILLLLTVNGYALPDELDWSGKDGISKKSLCLLHSFEEKLLKAEKKSKISSNKDA